MGAAVYLTGKGIKWFSHRLSREVAHVCVRRVLKCRTLTELAGSEACGELDVPTIFGKTVPCFLHMGFQSRREM